MDPAQWLADYEKTLARTAADARAASECLQEVGGRAASPRGEVEVTVSASGALEDLTLTPAARALEVDALAQLIMNTVRQAHRMVGNQVVQIMTEYLGEGPALDMVIENLPPAAGAGPKLQPVPEDDYEYEVTE